MSKNKHNRNNSFNPNMPRNNNVVVEDVVEDIDDVEDDIEDTDETDVIESVIEESTEIEIDIAEVVNVPVIETPVNIVNTIPEVITDPVVETCNTTNIVGYRVGIDHPIDERVFNNWESARDDANNQTKLTGMIHHVYDANNNIVFSAKKKLTLLSHKKRGNRNVNWYS